MLNAIPAAPAGLKAAMEALWIEYNILQACICHNPANENENQHQLVRLMNAIWAVEEISASMNGRAREATS